MLLALLALSGSAQVPPLHVIEAGEGDCFSSPCNYTTAISRLQNGATVIFEDSSVSITAPLSDLFQAAVFKNVSLTTNRRTEIFGEFGTVPLLIVPPTTDYRWGKVHGFTFSGFNTAVVLRSSPESVWPLVIFNNCSFVDNTQDVINVKGGTFQFDRCLFKNNSHRPLKIMSGTTIELTRTTVIDSNASFFYDCDLIIRNSQFINNSGARGGSMYVSKTTFLFEATKFVNNTAQSLGGAVYIGETGSDLASEMRNSCFIGNQAKTNGTSSYSYFSEVLFNGNCFSDSEFNAIVGHESNNVKNGNVFDSTCEPCLALEVGLDPFDPIEQEGGPEVLHEL
jgi:hypothetical protein